MHNIGLQPVLYFCIDYMSRSQHSADFRTLIF